MDESTALKRLWVQPSGAPLAADVHGIDLSARLSSETLAALDAAWRDHLVLRFSGQCLRDDQLVAFSRLFGDLDERPERAPTTDEPVDARWITSISNLVVDGTALGALGYGEASWHADMTYNSAPPRGSLLYCVESPPEGGSTWFSNMYAAWDALPSPMQTKLADLTCIHDASHDSTGRLRPGFSETRDPRQTPGARHPLVRVHPGTRRPCLFLGRRAGAYVLGLRVEESEALLDQLWAHATDGRFVWKQRWRVGDLIMWDNRCVLHRRDSFDPAARRMMRRTQISGEPVVGLRAYQSTTKPA